MAVHLACERHFAEIGALPASWRLVARRILFLDHGVFNMHENGGGIAAVQYSIRYIAGCMRVYHYFTKISAQISGKRTAANAGANVLESAPVTALKRARAVA